MAETLEFLADHCHGNDRPDCPILADLAEPTAVTTVPNKAPKFGVASGVLKRGEKGFAVVAKEKILQKNL